MVVGIGRKAQTIRVVGLACRRNKINRNNKKEKKKKSGLYEAVVYKSIIIFIFMFIKKFG
jgi:hypothetical protein